RPVLAEQLRVIAQLGPSGMPPWVIHKTVAPEVRSAVREALLTMHKDTHGQALLTAAQVSHFAAVTDENYNDVREMGRVARSVRLAQNDGYYLDPHPSSVETNVIC
ncbi:MAG: PhnD/SsuA/transferrin family substrate-binding protein, partial [Anaerolineales bacterium]|nr:PhnD/SsuA/transferrin family substrate-binding protein [Anaerolineales bacterium]